MKWLAEYTDPLGYLPLREQLQEKLKGFQDQAPIKQIMIPTGASDVLYLLVMSFLSRPGDTVLYGSPSPFMLLDGLMAVGLEPIAVRALGALYQSRFFFCSSVLQSTTSTQLSAHKAFQILRLAKKFNLTIVEDDT